MKDEDRDDTASPEKRWKTFEEPAWMAAAPRPPKPPPKTVNGRKIKPKQPRAPLTRADPILVLPPPDPSPPAPAPDGLQNQNVGQPTAPPPNDEAVRAWAVIREAYANDPVAFAIDIIGVTPDPWQAAAMDYVGKGGRLLSIRSGHGIGKTGMCAWLAIWQLVCVFPQKTVITAPTQGQLFDALYGEVKQWLRKMPQPIQDLFDVQAERIAYKAAPESSFLSVRTASKERPEALAGIHCEGGRVLLLVDEASGVVEPVFEAALGSMSGEGSSTVLISNPSRNTGLFHATHTRAAMDALSVNQGGKWKTMHVSSLDVPRARFHVEQTVELYGVDSNAYRVRVLGEFPSQEEDVLIAAALVDAATRRDIELDTAAPLTYGLDPARFGSDKTVLVKRRGQVVLSVTSWAQQDLMATVGRVINEINLDGVDKAEVEICIDTIGLGGGVADRLREQGYNVHDVNVSESTALNPTAYRLRDELWLAARDWFTQAACRIPDHAELKEDLCAPTYNFTSNGKLVVEPKALTKKRLRRSPDAADALCLTFAGMAGMIGGRGSSWVKGKAIKRNIPRLT